MLTINRLIKHCLKELGREQRELASAVGVTESYISQLLTGRKALPAPNRSDIYEKIGAFLKLPSGELEALANLERRETLKRTIEEKAGPLFGEIRELILRKCGSDKAKQLLPIFEKETFGEVERLITKKLLDVAKGIAKEEWKNENWLRIVARTNGKSYEEMRVIVLEFLDTDVLNLSVPNFLYFLDPLIESWDVDLVTFAMKVVLAPGLGRERIKKFEFVEREPDPQALQEPGLREFLQDATLSGDITVEELAFFKQMKFSFKGKRPTRLYYYRELQNLRDPLHFQNAGSK